MSGEGLSLRVPAFRDIDVYDLILCVKRYMKLGILKRAVLIWRLDILRDDDFLLFEELFPNYDGCAENIQIISVEIRSVHAELDAVFPPYPEFLLGLFEMFRRLQQPRDYAEFVGIAWDLVHIIPYSLDHTWNAYRYIVFVYVSEARSHMHIIRHLYPNILGDDVRMPCRLPI